MKYSLRPYQLRAVDSVIGTIKSGVRKIVLRAPTGAGKTIIASRIIEGAKSKGNRVVFLAHRTELIDQCSEKLTDIGVSHGIIQGSRKMSISELVQVASVQTLINRNIPEPQIIIIDEAHRARAKTYEDIVNRYPNAFVLGLTATPCRTDGRGLGAIFDKILDTIDYTTLIEQGYLVPFIVYAPPMSFSMQGVKKTAGDFNKKETASRLGKSKIYGDVIEHWQKKASDRSTIVFCCSVEHSKAMCDRFKKIGVSAVHIDGKTHKTKRKESIEKVRAGEIQVLCNVGIATEGTDLPIVSCIVLANPTFSLSLHQQMIGRGLRIHPESGKHNCLILDHVGNHNRLGWIDDEIEWTLNDKVKAKRSGKSERKAMSVRTCPKCFLAMKSDVEVCPSCGYKFDFSRDIKAVAGNLKEATRKNKNYRMPKNDPLTYYVKQIIKAKEAGYKRGWALRRFRFMFGKYPSYTPEQVIIKRWELTGVFD